MCGRYYLKISIEKLIEKYGILNNKDIEFKPTKEIFPSQKAPVIIKKENKKVDLFKWGFSPSFTNQLIINARSETLDEKKTFKKLFYSQRCIIPAGGFFEWKKDNNKNHKFNVSHKNNEIISFAGLYDVYEDESGNSVNSFVIITTEANKDIKKIHSRMPVILKEKDEEKWMNTDLTDSDDLKNVLKPYRTNKLNIIPEDRQMKLDF